VAQVNVRRGRVYAEFGAQSAEIVELT